MPVEPIAPLETSGKPSRSRIRYRKEQIAAFGSANDSPHLAAASLNQLTEVRNLRMERPGEYELRSGYISYTKAGAYRPMWKCEYRGEYELLTTNEIKDTLFDCTLVQLGTAVKLLVTNITPAPAGSVNFSALGSIFEIDMGVTLAASEIAYGCMVQSENIIFVSLYDHGSFIVYPQDTGAVQQTFDSWTAVATGKQVCPTPNEMEFADESSGDLFMYDYDRPVSSPDAPNRYGYLSGDGKYYIAVTFKPRVITTEQGNFDPRLPPYLFFRYPAGIPYYKSENAEFDFFNTRYYNAAADDPADNTFWEARSNYHLPERGWGYRFVFIRTITDAKGNKIKIRSHPSADVWVRDTIYCPPRLVSEDSTGSAIPTQIRGRSTNNVLNDPTETSATDTVKRFRWTDYQGNGSGANHEENVDPQNGNREISDRPDGAMPLMAQKLLKYLGSDFSVDGDTDFVDTKISRGLITDNGGAPFIAHASFVRNFLPTLVYAGMREAILEKAPESRNYDLEMNYLSGVEPYWTEIPASILAEAPLCRFAWYQFYETGTLPSDATEIEIYRTAYYNSAEKFADGTPAFQPHVYGYVGKIAKPADPAAVPPNDDGYFIDNIKDSALDWGKEPSRYNGYLEGRFSGKTIREYKNSIVLGDVRTEYQPLAPAGNSNSTPPVGSNVPWVFCFIGDGTGTYTDTDLNTILNFGISYIDTEGYESDITVLAIGNTPGEGAGNYKVCFQLPWGYEPNITTVRLYRATFTGAASTWDAIKDVPVGVGFYVSDGTEPAITTESVAWSGALPVALPTRNTIKTVERGTILWSEPHSFFHWKALFNERAHSHAPVTFMEVLGGRLWVWTDRGVYLTALNDPQIEPRYEEDTNWQGCIGRFSGLKVANNGNVFVLGASGLFYVQPDGPRLLSNPRDELLQEYLREQISGQPILANARRASMGWLGRRSELWLFFPASTDLGGSLPAHLFVFKMPDDAVREVIGYDFDLRSDAFPTIASLATSGTANALFPHPLIFCTHTDDRLFASFPNDLQTTLYVQDNDIPTGVWQGVSVFERMTNGGDVQLNKYLREITITGDLVGTRNYITGAPRSDGASSGIRGRVNANAEIWTDLLTGTNIRFAHVPKSSTATSVLYNTTSKNPVIRMVTQPAAGLHDVRYRAMDVVFTELHNHPV